MSHLIREACVENFIELKSAINKGANRIELNDNMSGWGTTPSLGTIYQGVSYCNEKNIPIIIMNRPRSGNFYYTKEEKEIILSDLEVIIQSGATGVALGALNKKNKLDKEFLNLVIKKSKENKLEVTFHRAFDFIPDDLQVDSLKWLAKLGVDRIATHGGNNSSNILENLDRLKELQDIDNRIEIMAGGGINNKNIKKVVQKTGINEVHGTKIV